MRTGARQRMRIRGPLAKHRLAESRLAKDHRLHRASVSTHRFPSVDRSTGRETLGPPPSGQRLQATVFRPPSSGHSAPGHTHGSKTRSGTVLGAGVAGADHSPDQRGETHGTCAPQNEHCRHGASKTWRLRYARTPYFGPKTSKFRRILCNASGAAPANQLPAASAPKALATTARSPWTAVRCI